MTKTSLEFRILVIVICLEFVICYLGFSLTLVLQLTPVGLTLAARCLAHGWWHTGKIFVKKVCIPWERLSSREQASIDRSSPPSIGPLGDL